MNIFIHNIKSIKVETNVLPSDTAVKIVTIKSSEGEYTLTMFADTFKQLEFNQQEEMQDE
jgi:hypothetical protein